MSKEYDYLIVGAGLAGSTIAYLLKENHYKVKVIDKRNFIGGNCHTSYKDGIHIHDYGAHIFHTSNKKVWDFVNKFADFNDFVNSPLAVTEDNELYNLPFNMNTFSKMFNTRWPNEVMTIIDNEAIDYFRNRDGITNLEEQAISMVGYTIYSKLIKGYTEKQWGKSCRDLDHSIIKRLPLRFTYDNNYFNDKYQGIPETGYTSMIDNMLRNIEVELGVEFNDNMLEEAKHVIYTGSIDELFDYELGKLEYRSLKFVTEKLDAKNYQGNAVVNYTGNTPDYTRIIEHKHFNNDDSDVTYITYEFPVSSGDPYYPINNEANNNLYKKYLELSENKYGDKIIYAGRLGKYKYFDMDDVIEDCISIVNDILDKEEYRIE